MRTDSSYITCTGHPVCSWNCGTPPLESGDFLVLCFLPSANHTYFPWCLLWSSCVFLWRKRSYLHLEQGAAVSGYLSSLTGGFCSVKADPVLQYASFSHHYPPCHMHRSKAEVPVLRPAKSRPPHEGSSGRESYSAHSHVLSPLSDMLSFSQALGKPITLAGLWLGEQASNSSPPDT